MTPLQIILIVSIVSGIVVLSLTLGLTLGLKNKPTKYVDSKEEQLGVLNSYDNTDVLVIPFNFRISILIAGVEYKKLKNIKY